MTILETHRLIIHTLSDADFANIFRMLSDPVTMRYIRAPVTDEQGARERMAMWEIYRENNPGLGVFGLRHKTDDSFAGYVTARHVDFKPESGEYEVGYVIAPEWWGHGFASEIVPPLSRYLFKLSGAPHLVAFTHPENAASQRVLLKNGFLEVGTRQVYEGESKEFHLGNSISSRVFG